MTKRGLLFSLLNFNDKVQELRRIEKEARRAANEALLIFDEEAFREARRRESLAHDAAVSMFRARLDMDYKRSRLLKNAQSRRRERCVFVDGRPHVEFCGTSREGASEADVSELFDKAKGAAIAALRSLCWDGVNNTVSDDADGDPFRRSVMRKFTRME